jgi:AraC family transcriptional regulator
MNREASTPEVLTSFRDMVRALPFAPTATSERLGWAGIEALRFRDLSGSEVEQPHFTHHRLVLINRPPEQNEVHCEQVDRYVPPSAGSILVIPAFSSLRWRWSGLKDSLHVFIEPRLVARVAAETFHLDPARELVIPVDHRELPKLRALMLAVDAELTAGEPGGRLAAESLANLLAVNLIRSLVQPARLARAPDGVLPRARLKAVVDYVEEHLTDNPSLEELAAVARISPYHFARQFRAATGLPPHQFVLARRVERARQMLDQDDRLPLAQVAARVGFSDQSQFTRHFKRIVGVTPGRFR